MNFTTLIMLIFTAILAIGLVSKGLSTTLYERVRHLSLLENYHGSYHANMMLVQFYYQ